MSKARHMKKHADGGKVEPALKPKPYNAQGSEVEKEAEEHAAGGKVKGFKRGGKVMEMEGKKAHDRMDRPGKKHHFARGGKVGSDKSPLTSAANVKNARDHSAEEGNADEGP